jgi:splicing factor 3B subunit 2
VETPDVIDLRKTQRKEPEKPLYHVLEEKEERIQPGTLLGASHTYVLPTGDKAAVKKVDLLKSQRTDKVDITLRPEELEGLDDDALAAKYEAASHEATLATQREDFSDMVAEVNTPLASYIVSFSFSDNQRLCRLKFCSLIVALQ